MHYIKILKYIKYKTIILHFYFQRKGNLEHLISDIWKKKNNNK